MSAEPIREDPAAERVLHDLSTELMSPYCPGRTIASCPSQQARKLEDHILAEAKSGKTREQIEAQLVERFGSDIVGYRAPASVTWGAAMIGALALGMVAVLGRRWVRRRAAGRAGSVAAAGAAAGAAVASEGGTRGPTREELDRLDDELDAIDEF
jgi:cytochrome c-type biogenesis protein CcmH/NrfF